MKLEEALAVGAEIYVDAKKLRHGKPGDTVPVPDIIFEMAGQRLQLDATKLRVLPKPS